MRRHREPEDDQKKILFGLGTWVPGHLYPLQHGLPATEPITLSQWIYEGTGGLVPHDTYRVICTRVEIFRLALMIIAPEPSRQSWG